MRSLLLDNISRLLLSMYFTSSKTRCPFFTFRPRSAIILPASEYVTYLVNSNPANFVTVATSPSSIHFTSAFFYTWEHIRSIVFVLGLSCCKLRCKLCCKLRELVKNTDNFPLHRQRGKGDNFLLYIGCG